MTETTGDTPQDIPATLLEAALVHVPFDGWSEATFRAAIRDAGIDPVVAQAVVPRGALDLAMLYHERADAEMRRRLNAEPMMGLKIREKITRAVRTRIEVIDDKEAVRRATTLFALPHHAGEGARMLWSTADQIWEAAGDTSRDVNWYTKRATLSGVYSATVLYWLGDDSHANQATWEFLDRRIEDVMRIEKAKAQMRDNPVLKRVFAGPSWVLGRIKAPNRAPRSDVPGRWSGPT